MLFFFQKFKSLEYYNYFLQKYFKIILFIAVALTILGFCFLFTSKIDVVQGISTKMLYIHLPAAWIASGAYFSLVLGAIIHLAYKAPFAPLIMYSTAFVGCFVNILCIITGMIWAHMTWGVYWVWDIRLTSVSILLIFYITYLAFFNIKNLKNKTPSILTIIGAINLPIIKFSVEFINGVHQPASILRKEGVAVDWEILYPLFFFLGLYIAIFFLVFIVKLNSVLLLRKIFAQLDFDK